MTTKNLTWTRVQPCFAQNNNKLIYTYDASVKAQGSSNIPRAELHYLLHVLACSLLLHTEWYFTRSCLRMTYFHYGPPDAVPYVLYNHSGSLSRHLLCAPGEQSFSVASFWGSPHVWAKTAHIEHFKFVVVLKMMHAQYGWHAFNSSWLTSASYID